MAFSALSFIAALVAGSTAFRVKPKKRNQGRPAQIGGIFAIAAPGSAQPGLQNPKGGCFPGIRWAAVKKQWFGQEADTATTITGIFGFKHPFMDFKLLDYKDPSGKSKLYNCGRDVQDRPKGLSKIALHNKDNYAAAMKDLDLGWAGVMHALSQIGNIESYNKNLTAAGANARKLGWHLIGSAIAPPGKGGYVGEQISHLFQKPESKECIVTFEGSTSFGDWRANLNLQKKPFCGYSKNNAFIADDDATDHEEMIQSGQSMVHKGFMDALMEIVKNSDWQTNIRAKFPSCSKVYATGHSLGGAQAELFGACINMAPQSGEDGYEHYKYMGWNV